MSINNGYDVAGIISDYIGYKQKSLYYHKKKNDAEKEYNKLLTISGGETRTFSLEEANNIYSAYREMLVNEEQLKAAEEEFTKADESLKELGQILFHGTITAQITAPSLNGEPASTKQVTVSFPNGQALVI